MRFFIFNAAGGIVWATVFGLGGYLLGHSIHLIAGVLGWVGLVAAVVFIVILWRYYKKHEDRFLVEAEAAMNESLQRNR